MVVVSDTNRNMMFWFWRLFGSSISLTDNSDTGEPIRNMVSSDALIVVVGTNFLLPCIDVPDQLVGCGNGSVGSGRCSFLV